jgi:sugar phosphate isomerase/epimerase
MAGAYLGLVLVHPATAGPGVDRQSLSKRLGADVPAGWWPTAPMYKGLEAAGFSWVQVRTPPRAMLCDRERLLRHAGALRATLETCGLRLVLHAPDDLSGGDPAHDRALDGLLDYAAATGARQVVYHAANFPLAAGGIAADRVRERAAAEEAALRARVPRLERLGVTLALENLAPVFPSPPRLGHDTGHLRELAERLGSPRVGLALDLGHAHIVAGLLGAAVWELVEPALDAVTLLHLHDNLGARRDGASPPGLDPLRLDLHLAPGGGKLPWEAVAGAILARPVPAVLEVQPPHRPEPLSLFSVTSELLLRGHPGARSSPVRPAPQASALAVPPG